MIITLIDDEINMDTDNFCCTLSFDTLSKLYDNDLIRRKTLSYKLSLDNRDIRLVCPMLKTSCEKNVALWPSIKLLFRKYPVHIYIYSAALYLSSDLTMRETAYHVRQKFGLENFSHSTISRALKKLSDIVDELLDLWEKDIPSTTPMPPVIKRCWWSDFQIIKYTHLFKVLNPVLNKSQSILFSSTLNYRYFNKTLKFVI